MTFPNSLQLTKNGWFRYRRAIPLDEHCFYKKKIYIECLHTRDFNEAKKLSHAISIKFNEHIERAEVLPVGTYAGLDWALKFRAGVDDKMIE